MDTGKLSKLHGFRATAGGVALVARIRSAAGPGSTEWDAYAAFVSPTGTIESYSVINIDRGDILFDIAPAADGGYLAAGATGYSQNPSGASISEQAAPLLVSLSAGRTVTARHAFAAGPRHNQMRSLVRRNSNRLVAGLFNGPGAHRGDADSQLIASDGFVREIGLGR